jgi:hypothetical protein
MALEFFVCKIDTQLLEAISLKALKSIYVENTNKPPALAGGAYYGVEARHKP